MRDATGIHFNLRMKQSVALIDTTGSPIAFNLGIPGFGLSVDGNVKVEIGYDFKLKFGPTRATGSTSTPRTRQELLEFKITIPGLHAKGQRPLPAAGCRRRIRRQGRERQRTPAVVVLRYFRQSQGPDSAAATSSPSPT